MCVYVCVHVTLRRKEPTWIPIDTNQLSIVEESNDREEEQTAGGRCNGMENRDGRNTFAFIYDIIGLHCSIVPQHI